MLKLTVVVALLAATAVAIDVSLVAQSELSVRIQDHQDGGLSVYVARTSETTTVGNVITRIGVNAGVGTLVSSSPEVVVRFNNTSVYISSREVQEPHEGVVINIEWRAESTERLEDCLNIGSNNWYGGPQQKRQLWPIEKLVLTEYSYVTKEDDNCGIAEPYWLSSAGTYFFFDKKVPLFVSQNRTVQDTICFIAEVKPPYSNKRDRLEMAYVIGIFNNVREAHEHAVATVLGKPSGYPDERMITYPIWSTWARYERDVNDEVIGNFSNEILSNNFPNSQLEIDDLWETCYGSLTVDTDRFPNMTNTVNVLKGKGFRVTIWVHPFLNKGCEPWYTDALNDNYLVISEDGSETTSWWNSNASTSAAYIDYTNPAARKWYIDRVRVLHDTYGIDSFKFDGGETSWSPQIPVLTSDVDEQPSAITADYVTAVAQFGPLVEVRSGFRTQNLPIFVRMVDKDSYWTFENGLPTLITTLLQMNLNGYTLVLPDMIGGNGYYNTKPTKELFIRWLQANVFMPSLQFSFVPWDYDPETVAISRQFVALHERYAPDVIKACQRSVAVGAPVNAPLWWIAPDDTTTFDIWDEFVLGEDIIAAPVVTQGAVTRDIYLPAGRWRELDSNDTIHEGPVWIRNFPAPLNVLPYFVRDSSTTPYISVFVLLLGLAAFLCLDNFRF